MELDGSGHMRHFNQVADLDKELELYELRGITVIRFDNNSVMTVIDGVLARIVRVADSEQS